MSKLTFPAAGRPYRGFVDKLRNYVREIATFVQQNDQAKAEVISQIGAFVNQGNTTIISSGQELSGVTPTGAYTNKVTFTVAGGVVTAIVLS